MDWNGSIHWIIRSNSKNQSTHQHWANAMSSVNKRSSALTDSLPAAVTSSCSARTDSACSITNTHWDRSGGTFLSAMFSKKQWRFPKPSAARQTRSPVAVHERHTMSSCFTPNNNKRDAQMSFARNVPNAAVPLTVRKKETSSCSEPPSASAIAKAQARRCAKINCRFVSGLSAKCRQNAGVHSAVFVSRAISLRTHTHTLIPYCFRWISGRLQIHWRDMSLSHLLNASELHTGKKFSFDVFVTANSETASAVPKSKM